MEKRTQNKIALFFKKNIYYIIMGLCIIAIATIITVTVVSNNKSSDIIPGDITNTTTPSDETNDPQTPPEVETPEPTPTIVFGLPVAEANVLLDYTMDTLVWNNTLQQYSVHTGIDFGGVDGTEVFSAFDGVVETVGYDILNGYTVTIKHDGDLSTYYSSMNEPTVQVGDELKKGDSIGTMGNTAGNSINTGSHLHFETRKAGVVSNPYEYLPSDNK